MPDTKREYTCAMCKNTYTAEWTDEEAYEECIRNFGFDPREEPERAIQICDLCYQATTIGGKPINFN